MDIKFKPCPFCGNTNLKIEEEEIDTPIGPMPNGYSINCCWTMVHCSTKEITIREWNKRCYSNGNGSIRVSVT